jgi:hypothetical protein
MRTLSMQRADYDDICDDVRAELLTGGKFEEVLDHSAFLNSAAMTLRLIWGDYINGRPQSRKEADLARLIDAVMETAVQAEAERRL